MGKLLKIKGVNQNLDHALARNVTDKKQKNIKDSINLGTGAENIYKTFLWYLNDVPYIFLRSQQTKSQVSSIKRNEEKLYIHSYPSPLVESYL